MHGVPDGVLDEAARRFSLLSDPTRLRVVRALLEHDGATVGELAGLVGTSLPNVSQHLSRLQAGGVVRRRRDGRSVRYAIADPTIAGLCEVVCRSVAERAVG